MSLQYKLKQLTSDTRFRVEELEPFFRDEAKADLAWFHESHRSGKVDQISLRTLLYRNSSSSCSLVGRRRRLGQSALLHGNYRSACKINNRTTGFIS